MKFNSMNKMLNIVHIIENFSNYLTKNIKNNKNEIVNVIIRTLDQSMAQGTIIIILMKINQN